MRRTSSVLMLAAVLAAVAWTLWTWVRPDAPSTDPWRAVPSGSIAIIELPDAVAAWDRITHSSQLWGVFEQWPAASAAGRIMVGCLSQMERDPVLREALQGAPLLLALLRTGEGPGALVIVHPRGGRGIPATALNAVLGESDPALAGRTSDGILVFRPDTALPALSVTQREGLLLLATSPTVLEEALLQLNGTAGDPDSLLTRLRGTLGAGADAHVLVHGERARHVLSTWWTPDALKDLDLPKGWTAMDLRVRADALLLSGLIATDEPHPMLTAIQGQGVGRMSVMQGLPGVTSRLEVQQISDPQRWLADRWPATTPDAATAAALFNWVEGEAGIATGWDALAGKPLQWAFFRTSDPEHAALALMGTCAEGTACDTMRYRDQRITRLGIMNAHERLLGPRYADFEQPWWTIWRDLVVFAPSAEELRTCIDSWTDGSTLAEDLRVMAGFERLGQEAGLTLWCDVARAQGLLSANMNEPARAAFRSHAPSWSRLGGLTLQVSPGQHGYQHVVIGVQHAPLEGTDVGVLWSSAIGAPITRAPDIVRNHMNDTREVLVQDVQHRLHLLASTGKVLWSRQLDGPVLGPVVQVDRFRNGKLQLLFNTSDRIHLIDRNGKNVGGFPVALPTAATAPLAVFDYENDRDYRIVIPCADGQVLNFSMDGTLVNGWKAPSLKAPATNTVRHLRIKNKDYLVLVDGDGKVLLLDRRGAERDRTPLELGKGAVVHGVLPGFDLKLTRVIWTDGSGLVREGTFNGEVTVPFPGSGPSVHVALDGDSILACVTGDSLQLFGRNGVRSVTALGSAPGSPLRWYSTGAGYSALGMVLRDREQVILLDRDGRPWPGSPWAGSVPFVVDDLDRDDHWELITATGNGQVVAYRLAANPTSLP